MMLATCRGSRTEKQRQKQLWVSDDLKYQQCHVWTTPGVPVSPERPKIDRSTHGLVSSWATEDLSACSEPTTTLLNNRPRFAIVIALDPDL
jgi:hypothetical protein